MKPIELLLRLAKIREDQAMANDFKEFAYSFYKKFSASQIAENK